jgi:hypothetical protein
MSCDEFTRRMIFQSTGLNLVESLFAQIHIKTDWFELSGLVVQTRVVFAEGDSRGKVPGCPAARGMVRAATPAAEDGYRRKLEMKLKYRQLTQVSGLQHDLYRDFAT